MNELPSLGNVLDEPSLARGLEVGDLLAYT